MAKTLTPTLKFTITGTRVNEEDKERASVSLSETISKAFTNGTGSGQVDQMFSDSAVIPVSTLVEYNFGAGAVDAEIPTEDIFGDVLTMHEIKAIIIKAGDANAGDLSFGAAGGDNLATMWVTDGDGIKIQPGGLFVLTAPISGYAAGADDVLEIVGTEADTFDIFILAVSA